MATSTLVVNTTLGPIRGLIERGGVKMFRGVPFAAPPTGSNRAEAADQNPTQGPESLLTVPLCAHAGFRPPQPAVPWTNVRPAINEYQCFQMDGLIGQEDCLYLHVAVPEQCSTTAPCAVLFWLFGGAYVIGSDNEFGWYDPADLARAHGVVVVAPNYRLGAFGFLAHPALQRETGGSVGNWAMLDQRAALKWARANVERFGGRPDAVTLTGESAGAISVCWHLGSEGSRGLFHRAILESGQCARHACGMHMHTSASSHGCAPPLNRVSAAQRPHSNRAILRGHSHVAIHTWPSRTVVARAPCPVFSNHARSFTGAAGPSSFIRSPTLSILGSGKRLAHGRARGCGTRAGRLCHAPATEHLSSLVPCH